MKGRLLAGLVAVAISQLAVADTGEESDDRFVARVGPPFLAYPGEVIVLSGETSTGPGRKKLEYRWEQTLGRPVQLSNDTAQRPTFSPEFPDTYGFELRVGRNGNFSAPAESRVFVVDSEGTDLGLGCTQSSSAIGGFALLLPLVFRRRQRRF